MTHDEMLIEIIKKSQKLGYVFDYTNCSSYAFTKSYMTKEELLLRFASFTVFTPDFLKVVFEENWRHYYENINIIYKESEKLEYLYNII